MRSLLLVAVAATLAAQNAQKAQSAQSAQGVRVIPFSAAQQFRMGKAVSNRIVHPAMGAKHITLNLSVTQPGTEFAQHIHDDSSDTIVILKGAAIMRTGDTRRPFKEGQIAYVPPKEIHGTITDAPDSVLISFQTPPDFDLYSGARDPSRGAKMPAHARITPGAVKYLDYPQANGYFLHPGNGAPKMALAHRKLKAGETLEVSVAAGAERVVFVWKGGLTATGQPALAERDTLFLVGPATAKIKASQDTTLIDAESEPAAGWGTRKF